VWRPCKRGQRVTGDRNIKKSISASFRGVLLVVLGIHVCAVLQQNLADFGGAFMSGFVEGCFASAEEVKE
jgi:hypothetical protein